MAFNNFKVGYVLSSLKRAYLSNLARVEIIRTRSIFLFVLFLYQKGLILSFKISSSDKIVIFLKYFRGRPLFGTIRLLSVPSKRIFCSFEDLMRLRIDKGFVICSTSKGYMLLSHCLVSKLGGELVCLLK